MSLILNDIHLPLLIKSTLSEHRQYKALPWNNLDQLSCLWAVFTKYKRNIQDGFRLENLSWRLWYRQSVLQRKMEPRTSEDIDFSTTNQNGNKQLIRARSLPDLSQWSQQKQLLNSSDTKTNVKQKFFITSTADDTSSVDEEEEQEEEEMEPKQEQLVFTKNTTKLNSFSSTATSALSKPVSLLTDMLQRTESNVSLVTSSGLRRCQSRYCRLDQFFLNTA
ncbi:hypothetical protein [Parasitella parasitica]|uniref:Nitrogen regulatory protein areA GATA-like domain-containing protein n=1 Tax=Parasitella parasitica TaxID=35722 RepID=A0A0B7NAQ0_9FUNG|nr:hypothetical protein [Parasitella parasitica]